MIDYLAYVLEQMQSDESFYERNNIPLYFKNKEIPLYERWDFFCNFTNFYWLYGKLSDHPDFVEYSRWSDDSVNLDMVKVTNCIKGDLRCIMCIPDFNPEAILMELKEKILEVGIRYFIVDVKY